MNDTEKPTIVYIACCADHGLHGERTDCFACGGPVEQIPMVQVDEPLRELPKDTIRKWVDGETYLLHDLVPELRAALAYFDDTPRQTRKTHHVETYKPRPRPEGETEAKIAAAVAQPGGDGSRYAGEVPAAGDADAARDHAIASLRRAVRDAAEFEAPEWVGNFASIVAREIEGDRKREAVERDA